MDFAAYNEPKFKHSIFEPFVKGYRVGGATEGQDGYYDVRKSLNGGVVVRYGDDPGRCVVATPYVAAANVRRPAQGYAVHQVMRRLLSEGLMELRGAMLCWPKKEVKDAAGEV
jgi:hypothetical protein